MEDEDLLRRPPAPRPYVPSNALLLVPPQAVLATRQLLQRAGRREACVFWYGDRDDVSVVRSVRAPVQQSFRGNYHVEPEAMSQMVHNLDANWRPLAQVHSHPGLNTEHSRYDDKMMSSRKVLSIVFPLYGVQAAPWPSGLGIHEWQIDYWHMLTPAEVDGRLALHQASALDVRDFR
ncbi:MULTISPECIES: Mov34/MPN/PAD-1 family protein [Sinorhizobium]|uniref:Mov34/MPN/PAD-1 family protein n=1 Tax=Sinorhizobium TaxID=28105 RepID=UPI0004865DD9|nr:MULTISPECIES: Mov34/MPN/PAD-1 family protein [Sinorhizobium]WOS66962.1 Mov34/MPN/PAD-1 family protein [Sinorhizobium fredii GR64]